MDWIRNVLNKEELPEKRIWVSIQGGKAADYSDHTAFAEREKVIAFPSRETADYFIQHWDRNTMYDYKQACMDIDHTFWVIQPLPSGKYYADDIRVWKEETIKE
jgi:hypothetical protein